MHMKKKNNYITRLKIATLFHQQKKNQSNPITIVPATVFLRVFNRRSIDYARFVSSLVLPGQSGELEEEGTRAEATVPRNGDTVAKEPARDESLPRSGLLTRLQQLDLRHRVGIVA